MCVVVCCFVFLSSRRRHTRCALVTGVQTCALPIFTDCRNAGIDLERDPAVILLARHLGTVCETRAPDADLRRDCIARIAELRNRPVLKTLAYRGVAHDEPAKRLFHSEGRAAMRDRKSTRLNSSH